MIFGLGPTEFFIVLAFALIFLFIILNSVRKESRSSVGAPLLEGGRAARFWTSYSAPYRDYATFRGRATVREFWTFVLVNMCIAFLLSRIDVALGLAASVDDLGPLYGAFALATLVPLLAVMVRRLHDGDRAAWWILVHQLPLIGWIIALYQLVGRGTHGVNRFGPDPREDTSTVSTIAQ